MPDISLNDILKSFGIKDEFTAKSKQSIEDAKEGAWDKSIFDDKEAFVEHYTEEIFDNAQKKGFDVQRSGFLGLFGEVDAVGVDSFISNAVENGFMDEDRADGYQAIIDRNDDGYLDKEELNELIGTAYDAYMKDNEDNNDVGVTEPDESSPAEPSPEPDVPDPTTPDKPSPVEPSPEPDVPNPTTPDESSLVEPSPEPDVPNPTTHDEPAQPPELSPKTEVLGPTSPEELAEQAAAEAAAEEAKAAEQAHVE